MDDPIREWLHARLKRAPATPQELEKESLALGITPKELSAACGAAGAELQNGCFVLPDGPKAPKPITRADELQPKKPAVATLQTPDPKDRVRRAKARLAKHSIRHVRYLEELAEFAGRDPQKCPTCGRGTPRAESIRLQAILAALGMAGVAPNKNDQTDDGQSAPAIVFPPGTRIAVLAESPASQPDGVGRPEPPREEFRSVRADRIS